MQNTPVRCKVVHICKEHFGGSTIFFDERQRTAQLLFVAQVICKIAGEQELRQSFAHTLTRCSGECVEQRIDACAHGTGACDFPKFERARGFELQKQLHESELHAL